MLLRVIDTVGVVWDATRWCNKDGTVCYDIDEGTLNLLVQRDGFVLWVCKCFQCWDQHKETMYVIGWYMPGMRTQIHLSFC